MQLLCTCSNRCFYIDWHSIASLIVTIQCSFLLKIVIIMDKTATVVHVYPFKVCLYLAIKIFVLPMIFWTVHGHDEDVRAGELQKE